MSETYDIAIKGLYTDVDEHGKVLVTAKIHYCIDNVYGNRYRVIRIPESIYLEDGGIGVGDVVEFYRSSEVESKHYDATAISVKRGDRPRFNIVDSAYSFADVELREDGYWVIDPDNCVEVCIKRLAIERDQLDIPTLSDNYFLRLLLTHYHIKSFKDFENEEKARTLLNKLPLFEKFVEMTIHRLKEVGCIE